MIDEYLTLAMFGYTSSRWKQKSQKPVVAVCDECNNARIVAKVGHSDLCYKCAHKPTAIVLHHFLYDHSDLSKNRISMTVSQHSRMHNYMRSLGLQVPHINVEDDGIWDGEYTTVEISKDIAVLYSNSK